MEGNAIRIAIAIVLLLMSLAAVALTSQADTITQNVAAMLTADAAIPLGPGVALELATNLMTAQANSTYAASEPDSLTLSVGSVLRAITLEQFPGGPSEILNEQNAPYPFIESTIAIDDRVTVAFYVDGVLWQPGEVINFGSVPVSTPEPASLGLLIAGIAIIGIGKLGLTKLRK